MNGAVSLAVSGTDSAGEALTYSDNGSLPPGLAIDPGTGLITGTLTTPGSYPVTITATDTSGITGSVSFTWTVSSVSAPGRRRSRRASPSRPAVNAASGAPRSALMRGSRLPVPQTGQDSRRQAASQNIHS